MLELMEKYSYNLEGLVQERTHQLMEEKKKTEELLYRMLPRWVDVLHIDNITYTSCSPGA